MALVLLDMSAFKAANPDATFEDFIRWHSPGDWEADDGPESSGSASSDSLEKNKSKDSWPPRGKLSKRMSEHGNLWRKIWNSSPALPASEQKPLLDPNREGEKVSILKEFLILFFYCETDCYFVILYKLRTMREVVNIQL